MENKKYTFKAILKKHPDLEGYYVEFPFDVEKEFNGRGRVKIKCLFDGYEYWGSLVSMGLSCHIVGVTKAVRDKIAKKEGDTINVELSEDSEKRIIEIPEDFKNLLVKKNLLSVFENLSFTDRKEIVVSITSAKKPETRNKRIFKSINIITAKKK